MRGRLGRLGTRLTLKSLERKLSSTFVTVVDAGTNLSTARPVGAAAVYWKFDAGVDAGVDGANIVNAQAGDTYFVASA